MGHQRSDESYARRWKKWEDWKAEKDLPRRIVLDYSYHDYEIGEKVFTSEMEGTIRSKLTIMYGYIPQHALQDTEYGDVLNRFPLKVQQRIMKYHGWLIGGFQR